MRIRGWNNSFPALMKIVIKFKPVKEIFVDELKKYRNLMKL